MNELEHLIHDIDAAYREKLRKEGKLLASLQDKPALSRQQRRAECRKIAWWRWRVFRDNDGAVLQGPKDDNGLMPRRQRRNIALGKRRGDVTSLAVQAFRRMRNLGTDGTRSTTTEV